MNEEMEPMTTAIGSRRGWTELLDRIWKKKGDVFREAPEILDLGSLELLPLPFPPRFHRPR